MAQVQCPTCRATTATDTGFCQYCHSPLAAAPGAPLPPPVVGAAPAMNYATAVPPPGTPPPQQWPHPPAQGWPQGVPPPPPQGQPAWPAQAPQGAAPPWPPAQQPGPMAQAPPPPYGYPPPGAPAPYGYPPPGAPPPGMMPTPGMPPAAYYPPAGPPTAKKLGSDALALRIVAIIIDGIIAGIAAFVVSFLWLPLGILGGLISWWFPSVVLAIYMMVMEGSRAQTIGKMLLNLKVVREDGGPVTMKEAQARALGVLLWPLLIFILLDLIWVADEGQRLGDKWAHTTVIKVA